MIPKSKSCAICCLIVVALFFVPDFCLEAQTPVEYGGVTYPISENTVILDREGILNIPDACEDVFDAFEKINSIGNKATLLVAPSVYWLDDPDDPSIRTDKDGTPFAVSLHCDSLSIIGLSKNAKDVVFAVNRGQTQGAIGNFTMFRFSGSSLELKNITFGNYCNVDLIYPRNENFNRQKRKDAIVQAQIGICDKTERLYAENCNFISRLNLCPFIGARRSLYDNCYFECTDDALSGSSIYLDCRFTFFSSKPFYSTAETGAVFLNCDINCIGSGVQYFTKVPGKVTAIDTRFHSENPIEIKWTRDVSDIICQQENISLNGASYIIDFDRPELSQQLAKSELRNAYVVDYGDKKIYNLPNLLNGNDQWDPKGLNSIISNIEKSEKTKLTELPVQLRVASKTQKKIFDGDMISFNVTPLLWGGYPTLNEDEITYIAENNTPYEKKVIIPISNSNGLEARKSLTVEPKLRKAPSFKKKPKIRFDEASKRLCIDYGLSGKGEDSSSIIWGRLYYDEDGPKVVTLTESVAPQGRYFIAKAGDLGYGIVAIVTPKFKDSESGMPEASPVVIISDASQVEEIPESHLITDFSDLYIEKRLPGIPGAWSFDVFKPYDTSNIDWMPTDGCGWYYGKGFDASTGMGLVQAEKGARISYVPARDICKNMTATLITEPAKSGGQGFGSATTQYMDICVKFDPINLNGYALRIERTPDHDKAVRFSLIKYKDGKTYVISEEVISNCFRSPCYISVGITDGILYASAYSEAGVAKKCCDDVVDKVEISVPVDDNTLTGFCIQHTGSTGPSSTLIRDLNLNWE